MTRFVDATGFPVLPSPVGRGYWYREDARVARGREEFWGSRRWKEVQRLLDEFNKEGHCECPEGFEPAEHLGLNMRNEIAFEVP